jgi:hypothetical protein
MMAILYRVAANCPILVAANREEFLARPTQYPKIQSGSPRVVCGIDKQLGGTWLGVNHFGLLVTVTNRSKPGVPLDCRSRGLLCRDLLNCRSAREAAECAAEELATGRYDGANYVCLDQKFGAVVYGGNRVEIAELTPGLHTLSNGNLDDQRDPRHEFIRRMLTLQKLNSAVTFLAVASRAFSRPADSEGRRGVVLTGREFGTVSSSLLALPRKIQHSVFHYCNGAPSEKGYDDLSALLRQVLSAGRSRRLAEKAAAEGQKTDACQPVPEGTEASPSVTETPETPETVETVDLKAAEDVAPS